MREPGRDARGRGGVQRAAAQVNAVGADRQRDVDPVVDVQPDAGGRRDRAQRARQFGEGATFEVLLAKLHGHIGRAEAARRDPAQRRRHQVGQGPARRRRADR